MHRLRTTRKKKVSANPDLLKTRLLLRLAEWAALTGTPLPTAYKLAAKGEIAGLFRVGNTFRISVASVVEQIAAVQTAAGGEQ